MDEPRKAGTTSREQPAGETKKVNAGEADDRLKRTPRVPADVSGKTDSGPEPDVFGLEIPPQD